MERRYFIKNAALTIGLLTLARQEMFARTWNYSPWNFKLLRNQVGIFTEKGGTIGWLNSPEGFAVVDAQFPDTAPHVIEELKRLNDHPFKYLINTHYHGDHTSGNIAFKGIAEKVVAHVNSLQNQKNVAIAAKNEDQQLYPDITFANNWSAKLGNEHIKAHYFGPGHTNGDSIIHFENANIAHMGDLVFNRRFPFIDKKAGASIKNWITILDKALSSFDKDTLFIFGHSLDPEKVTGKKEDLKAFQNYLQRLLDFVAMEIKAGKTLENIKVSFIPGAEEWTGDGINRSLSAAFEELK